MQSLISAERARGLRQLAQNLTYADYAALDLPLSVARLTPPERTLTAYNAALQNFDATSDKFTPVDAGKKSHDWARTAADIVGVMKISGRRELVDGRFVFTNPDKVKVRAHVQKLVPLTKDIFEQDQLLTGGRWKQLMFDYMQDTASAIDARTPNMHRDAFNNERELQGQNWPAAGVGDIARLYALRSDNPAYYLRDSAALQPEGRALLAMPNGTREEQDAQTAAVRASNYHFRPNPGEIVLFTEATEHFSATPAQPVRSSFGRWAVLTL